MYASQIVATLLCSTLLCMVFLCSSSRHSLYFAPLVCFVVAFGPKKLKNLTIWFVHSKHLKSNHCSNLVEKTLCRRYRFQVELNIENTISYIPCYRLAELQLFRYGKTAINRTYEKRLLTCLMGLIVTPSRIHSIGWNVIMIPNYN